MTHGDEQFDAAWRAWLEPARLFGLEGRVAVVTGAAGGIGRWLAAGLGAAGASVLVTDRDPAATERTAGELRAIGIRAEGLPVDLADDDAPDRIVDAAVARLGGLHVVVNNAGVNRRMPMLDVEREMLREIWKIDFEVPYRLSQLAARVMSVAGGGSIIHISSANNAIGLEGVSILGPTKAALSQLTKVMTVEFAEHGVRTNSIAPGFMDTPMNVAVWEDEHRAPWVLDRVPMMRPGHPAELVGCCLLLASDAGSFISGQTIYVDGGLLSGSRWTLPLGHGIASWRSGEVRGFAGAGPAPAARSR